MADIIDEAQRAEALEIRAALGAWAVRRMAETRRPTLEQCMDCGRTIPEARRQAVPGCCRCVQCQTEADVTAFEREYPL